MVRLIEKTNEPTYGFLEHILKCLILIGFCQEREESAEFLGSRDLD